MFVGKIGIHNPMEKMPHMRFGAQSVPQVKIPEGKPPRMDRLERNTATHEEDTSFLYTQAGNMWAGNRLQVIEVPEAEQMQPDARLTKEILAPSEKPPMTEKDALMNQYMKQFRFELRIEGDKIVAHSETGKLAMPNTVTDEELEAFRNQLVQNGLGEIDWKGVSGDFWGMDMNFDNIENFEMKADYLASRYAVLKDRIQTEYTGEKREAEMAKLEEIYSQTKEEFADSFAQTVGGFYEDLGQSGVAADMKASVLAMVDSKTAAYEEHLKQAGDYANLEGSENQWLRQDDGYMASKLREHMAAAEKVEAASQTTEKPEASSVPYSKEDLVFAGMYAKTMSKQIETATWDFDKPDEALGDFFVQQKNEMEKHLSGVSDRLSGMIRDSFSGFMDKYMDTLDQKIEKNREWVSKRPHLAGMLRTDYIDRSKVFHAFEKAFS